MDGVDRLQDAGLGIAPTWHYRPRAIVVADSRVCRFIVLYADRSLRGLVPRAALDTRSPGSASIRSSIDCFIVGSVTLSSFRRIAASTFVDEVGANRSDARDGAAPSSKRADTRIRKASATSARRPAVIRSSAVSYFWSCCSEMSSLSARALSDIPRRVRMLRIRCPTRTSTGWLL